MLVILGRLLGLRAEFAQDLMYATHCELCAVHSKGAKGESVRGLQGWGSGHDGVEATSADATILIPRLNQSDFENRTIILGRGKTGCTVLSSAVRKIDLSRTQEAVRKL